MNSNMLKQSYICIINAAVAAIKGLKQIYKCMSFVNEWYVCINYRILQPFIDI